MIFVVLGFAVIFFIDLRPLIKNGPRRNLVATSIILLLGFALSALYAFRIYPPSMMFLFDNFVKDVLHFNY